MKSIRGLICVEFSQICTYRYFLLSVHMTREEEEEYSTVPLLPPVAHFTHFNVSQNRTSGDTTQKEKKNNFLLKWQ